MEITRRSFLKLLGGAIATTAAGLSVPAYLSAAPAEPGIELLGADMDAAGNIYGDVVCRYHETEFRNIALLWQKLSEAGFSSDPLEPVATKYSKLSGMITVRQRVRMVDAA